jgi:hypothetical protein
MPGHIRSPVIASLVIFGAVLLFWSLGYQIIAL